ncbi:MAG: HAMP domain-containing protein [Verrucomicrobiales bacterium]|nr:HAMP domain-containing protein [Verrucomicrobiales bacterium]
MKLSFQSLRWRLQAWHGLLLVIVIVGFTVPTYHFAKESQTQRTDRELGRMERGLIRSLMDVIQGFQPDEKGGANRQERPMLPFSEFLLRLIASSPQPPDSVVEQFQGTEPGYTYYSIRDRNDQVILQSENAPNDMVFLPVPESETIEVIRNVGNRRESSRTNIHGMKVVVGRDITPEMVSMQKLASLHLLIGFAVWFLGLVGGWWLSGRAIRPIQTISETATRIAEGNLEERIDVTEADSELGQLSQVLNQTFERLHDAFERQRQFTGDASHELRTPIAILISETQRILKRERTSAEYREALQTCGETAQRMRRLVEALLLLARQEGHTVPCKKPCCDLVSVLQQVVVHLKPMAEEFHRRISLNLEPSICHADSEAMAILATNLLSNAYQHGGNVVVSTRVEGNEVVFVVCDDGPGIEEVDLPHIFERFYRVDQARVGGSGHTGLGLAIAKAIVDNHDGSIRVNCRTGQGTFFEVRLPNAASSGHGEGSNQVTESVPKASS